MSYAYGAIFPNNVKLLENLLFVKEIHQRIVCSEGMEIVRIIDETWDETLGETKNVLCLCFVRDENKMRIG